MCPQAHARKRAHASVHTREYLRNERLRFLITTLGSKQGEEKMMVSDKDWLAEALADWIESIIAGECQSERLARSSLPFYREGGDWL